MMQRLGGRRGLAHIVLVGIVIFLVVGVGAQAGGKGSTSKAPEWKVYDRSTDGRWHIRKAEQIPLFGVQFDLLCADGGWNTRYLHTGLRADLTGKTITARIGVFATTGTEFTYGGEGTPSNPCTTPANVRLQFQTVTAGGWEDTDYWWSNPVSATMSQLVGDEAVLSVPLDPALWSDIYGHFGTFDDFHREKFTEAVAKVREIGLSFGGGCFFASGVAVKPVGEGPICGEAIFQLRDYSIAP